MGNRDKETQPPLYQAASRYNLNNDDRVDACTRDLQAKYDEVVKHTWKTFLHGRQHLPKDKFSLHKRCHGFPISPKFKVPQMDPYDGSFDPIDHIETYKAHMSLQGVPDEIMCRAFPVML